jgi:hypothetical protein
MDLSLIPIHSMTEDEIRDAMEGLYAYDTGCVSSGIHDEVLRRRVLDALEALPATARRAMLARICRELYLTDGAIALGYGCEDAGDFVRWLDERMESIHIA